MARMTRDAMETAETRDTIARTTGEKGRRADGGTGMKADAVFEGGGVKAIGLVGALSVAERLGYRWVNVAGSSAGAIVAALVAAGYRAAELEDIFRTTDFRMFRDPPAWGRLPLVGPVLSLL